MNGKIYTFALLTSLYDTNKDILDAFLPLIVRGMSTQYFENTNDIQKKVNEDTHIDIPIHVLKTLAIRAVKKRYAEKETNKSFFRRTKKGEDYVNSLEEEIDVQRKINGFFESFKEFALKNELTLNQEQAKSIVFTFLNENISDLVEFFSPQGIDVNINKNKLSKIESRIFTKYLLSIFENDQENYSIFKELIQGSIIASVLSAKYSDNITLTQDKKFIRNTEIYLDTNVVFSLLGLHTSEKNIAAKELLDLLKSVNFSLKVFDFTVDEIARYITSYLQNSSKYSSVINVDSIYSTLKQKNWGKSDVLQFVSKLDELIKELGIQIDYQFKVNLNNYVEKDSSLRYSIGNYKKNQPLSSSNHDIAAIEKIRELRRKSVRRIEDAKVFFLTSDYALQRFNYIQSGHKENGTFGEVILDRVLTSILWIKDTSIEIPISTIMASHSRDLFINRKVWEKFYLTLQQLYKDEKINLDSVATLFYRNYIEDSLQSYDEFSINEIDDKLVMDKIEEAEKKIDEEKGILEKNVFDLARNLIKKEDEKKEDIEKFSIQILKIRSNIKKISKRKSSKYYYLIYMIIVIIGCILSYYIHLLFPKMWQFYLGQVGVLLLVIPGVSKGLKHFKVKNKLDIYFHAKMSKALMTGEEFNYEE